MPEIFELPHGHLSKQGPRHSDTFLGGVAFILGASFFHTLEQLNTRCTSGSNREAPSVVLAGKNSQHIQGKPGSVSYQEGLEKDFMGCLSLDLIYSASARKQTTAPTKS